MINCAIAFQIRNAQINTFFFQMTHDGKNNNFPSNHPSQILVLLDFVQKARFPNTCLPFSEFTTFRPHEKQVSVTYQRRSGAKAKVTRKRKADGRNKTQRKFKNAYENKP